MARYVPREIEKEILCAARDFPVIILTGPRQTGKSTTLRKLFPKHEYITLDDPMTRRLAFEDSMNFILAHPRVIINEIQYAPELLHYIKIETDKDRSKKGRFILTGSQYFPLMQGVSESLAGRAAVYELFGFSVSETGAAGKNMTAASSFEYAFTGGYPEVVVQGADRNRFFSSYLQTYLERDIRQITAVHDIKAFHDFFELLAARAASLFSLSEISKDCGISYTSAKRWLSVLETTRTVFLLRPYARNISKRVIKSPKLYFTDSGLLSFILRYQNAKTLRNGPQSGTVFENLVVSEILKYKLNHNKNFEMYFLRDSNHNEVDLVLDFGMKKKLVEIKATSTPRYEHLTSLKKAMGILKNSLGFLACVVPAPQRAGANLSIIPWNSISSILK